MIFDQIIPFTMRWEGGFNDDPDDPGKTTNYGISKRAHPEVDVANLTQAQAIEIYRAKYWSPLCELLPRSTGLAYFDWGVHSNRRLVTRHLQRCAGLTRRSVDGVLGPQTVAAVQRAAHGGPRGDQNFACKLVEERVRFLLKLMRQRPKLRKYEWGWLRRTHALVAEIHRL